MMTQKERMEQELIYDPGDLEIMDEQGGYMDRLWEFNQLKPSQQREKQAYMKETFAQCGENCYIELPFYANWGGKNIHFGDYVYANFGLTCVDDTHIYIGEHTMIGPNCVLATANHPILPELREKAYQYNLPIRIGRNCWLGAGVIVVPGVTIGDNTVIGAGSVVTKDIPANVVAVGNPCHVLRTISEHDKEYFYRDRKINWDAL